MPVWVGEPGAKLSPEASEAPAVHLLSPVTAVGGGRSVGAGLRRVLAVTLVAAAAAVTGNVPCNTAMEAMEGREGELLYLDGMEAEHRVVRLDDGGEECRFSRDPH